MIQAIFLMLGYILMITRLGAEDSEIGCYVIAVVAHYFMIGTTIWSLLFAVEITGTIACTYAVNQLCKKKFRKYVRLRVY